MAKPGICQTRHSCIPEKVPETFQEKAEDAGADDVGCLAVKTRSTDLTFHCKRLLKNAVPASLRKDVSEGKMKVKVQHFYLVPKVEAYDTSVELTRQVIPEILTKARAASREEKAFASQGQKGEPAPTPSKQDEKVAKLMKLGAHLLP